VRGDPDLPAPVHGGQSLSSDRLRSAVRNAATAIACAIALAWAVPPVQKAVTRDGAAAVDLVPLWCRARIALGPEWRCTPDVLETVFHRRLEDRGIDPDDRYPYPPTTAVLFLPTVAVPWSVLAPAWRILGALGVAACAVAPAFAAAGRGLAPLGPALLVAAFLLDTRLVGGSLVAGQSGPVIAGLTAISLALLARGRDGWAGTVAGVGAGLKLLPVVLLAAALRRRSFVLACLGVLGALAAGAALLAWNGAPPTRMELVEVMVNPPPRASWTRTEPAWLLALWRVRIYAVGVPSVLLLLWSLWRPRGGPAATGAVLAAWAGTALAGSHQVHEAVVALPAVGWVLAWPLSAGLRPLPVAAAACLFLGMWAAGVTRLPVLPTSLASSPHSLAWLPVAVLAWALCVVRWGAEARAPLSPR